MPKDHADPEDQYFHREDQEKLQKLKEKAQADEAAAALQARRDAHWNKCGKCGADMETQIFRGVELEICPACGAVLLDSGELQTLAGKDQGGVFELVGALFNFSRKKREG